MATNLYLTPWAGLLPMDSVMKNPRLTARSYREGNYSIWTVDIPGIDSLVFTGDICLAEVTHRMLNYCTDNRGEEYLDAVGNLAKRYLTEQELAMPFPLERFFRTAFYDWNEKEDVYPASDIPYYKIDGLISDVFSHRQSIDESRILPDFQRFWRGNKWKLLLELRPEVFIEMFCRERKRHD